MKIQIQQLLQNTWFNLSNLNQTFTQHDSQYFFDNELGNLYKIISFNPKYDVYTIEEA